MASVTCTDRLVFPTTAQLVDQLRNGVSVGMIEVKADPPADQVRSHRTSEKADLAARLTEDENALVIALVPHLGAVGQELLARCHGLASMSFICSAMAGPICAAKLSIIRALAPSELARLAT